MSTSHHNPTFPLPSLPLPQASHLLISFTQFLTVAIHNILYYRNLYPATTFLTTRAYNLPVHQSRHPSVCAWIRDAVDAIRAQLVSGGVERIAIAILQDGPTEEAGNSNANPATNRAGRSKSMPVVLERWMIDVSSFPTFAGFREPRSESHFDFRQELQQHDERDTSEDHDGTLDAPKPRAINWTDVDEQFRGAVRRMAHAGEKMSALPDGCTFTIAVELREEGAEAPIGYPQQWIPSQPNLQTKSKERAVAGEDVGGAKTTPIRAVDAGPLFFECWVEEGEAKVSPESSKGSSSS